MDRFHRDYVIDVILTGTTLHSSLQQQINLIATCIVRLFSIKNVLLYVLSWI